MELAIELVFIIMETAYYANDSPWIRDPDYKTIASCSLVAVGWRHPAQQLLFRRITFDKAPAFTKLCFQFNRHTVSLLQEVRSLEIAIGHNTNGVDAVVGLLHCLERCPALYELSLRIHGYFQFDDDVLEHLGDLVSKAQSPLRSLKLLECSVQSPIIYQLLSVFSSVRFLSVGVEIVASPPAGLLSDLQLYELVIYRSLPYHVLSWILPSTHSSLRVLELREPLGLDTTAVIVPHLHRLHSLRLMVLGHYTESIPPQCISLREMVIQQLPSFKALVGILPPSVEHVWITNQTATGLPIWSNLVGLAGHLASLKLLTVHFVGQPTMMQDTGFVEFQAICKRRGIAYRFFQIRAWPVSLVC